MRDMSLSNTLKRTVAGLFFILCMSLAFSASKMDEYDALMQTGTAEHIANALELDSKMIKVQIAPDKDTLLMRALKYDRPAEIIELLINSGINVSAENKTKQNALIYACHYSSDVDAIKLVLAHSGKKKAIRRKLLKKDAKRKNALDYIRDAPNLVAQILVSEYLTKADIKRFLPNSATAMPAMDTPEKNDAPPESDAAAEQSDASHAQEPDENLTAQEDTADLNANNSEENAADESLSQQLENEPDDDALLPQTDAAVGRYQKTYLYDYLPKDEPLVPSAAEPSQFGFAKINDPNRQDSKGRTALMCAVMAGNDWEIRSLLKSGADVNISDDDGWTALMYAARYQDSLDLMTILLQNGAAVHPVNRYGASALQLAACYSSNPDIVRKLISFYPAGTNEIFKSFILTLTSVSKTVTAQSAKIDVFIERGIPLNRFYEGKTPLMYAAEFCQSTKIIKQLLENGAIPSIRNAQGKTAFSFAETNAYLAHDEIYWSLNSR